MNNKNYCYYPEITGRGSSGNFYGYLMSEDSSVETPEIATRGKVGKVIDSVYVNEEKKTTTVKFVDGTIQTITCHPDDVFDPYVGVAIAVSSFVFGNKKQFHEVVDRKIRKSGKKNKFKEPSEEESHERVLKAVEEWNECVKRATDNVEKKKKKTKSLINNIKI